MHDLSCTGYIEPQPRRDLVHSITGPGQGTQRDCSETIKVGLWKVVEVIRTVIGVPDPPTQGLEGSLLFLLPWLPRVHTLTWASALSSSVGLQPACSLPLPVCSQGVQLSSVTQSCLTLCDPMNRGMPDLPVHHQLPEFTQTHVHGVGDAIQPSHPLSSPPPLAFHLSQPGAFLKDAAKAESTVLICKNNFIHLS